MMVPVDVRLARFAAIGVIVGLVGVSVVGCSGGGAAANLSSVVPSGSVTVSGSALSGSAPTGSSTSGSAPSGSLATGVAVVPGIPADVPRTGHNVKVGERPPSYPVAALARSQAGANAFAVFFMQTLDWAYATTNPSYMKHYYGPTCGLCSGLATGIRKTAAAKHFYEGGRFGLRAVIASPIGSITAPADYCSVVTMSVPAQTVVDQLGNIVNGSGAASGVRFKTCEKMDGTWSVSYLDRL